jgi:hypothetical protein
VLFRVLACLLFVPCEANRHTAYGTTFNGDCRASRPPGGLTLRLSRASFASAELQPVVRQQCQ